MEEHPFGDARVAARWVCIDGDSWWEWNTFVDEEERSVFQETVILGFVGYSQTCHS